MFSHRHCHPALKGQQLSVKCLGAGHPSTESSWGAAVSRAVLTVEHLATVLSLVKDPITVNFSCFTLVCHSPLCHKCRGHTVLYPRVLEPAVPRAVLMGLVCYV